MPKVPFWIFILIAALYFSAVKVDTMDVDASQYAEISREMLKSGDYVHIYDRGHDYLDKPPFLFWASATSMKVFGVNNLGYKFPSILFALLAIFATYRLTKLLYNEEVGRMAALVLATCQGMFLMTNDVRCDTILMGWVITAIWLIKEWYVKCRSYYLLLGFAAIGFGMMTKGPIALMVPVFCFSADWALKRQWRNFFRPAYLVGFVIVGVILLPMSIGLYQQFDLHPEKVVNGAKGVSGLRFFYWTQSFGRITGESTWKNGADISFLLVNMVWSFLPWIFIFIAALIMNCVKLVKQKFRPRPQDEWISTGGFILSYLALGLSAYQLPHYIFVAFPLAAIVTARFIYELSTEGRYPGFFRFMTVFHIGITGLLIGLTLLLITYVFPAGFPFIGVWVVCALLWIYLMIGKKIAAKLLWLPATGLIIVNIFLSNHVYPSLLQYEVGASVGRSIKSMGISTNSVVAFKMRDPLNSIHFYAEGVVDQTDTISNITRKKYVLTMDDGIDAIKRAGLVFETVKSGELFKVSELTPQFLNPKTRSAATKRYYFLKIN